MLDKNKEEKKILNPVIMLGILGIFFFTIVAVINITPKTYEGKHPNILGVKQTPATINTYTLKEEHPYIKEETFEQISEKHYKYTAIVKMNNEKKISKTIVKIEEPLNLKTTLIYTNSSQTKISLIHNKTKYILKEINRKHNHKIQIYQPGNISLLIENQNKIYFDQFLEIHFFLE